jgi:Flp pilus assembly protein CpaB
MQMVHKLLATRAGTVAISALAALLAAVILIGYLHRYRQSVDDSSRPMTVLVAKTLIEKGTPGSIVGSQDLFQVTTTPRDELKEGALADPAALKGQVAAEDIYPGQQLTATDFVAGDGDALANRVVEYERGMAVPVDESHGLVGQVQTGDHVDVIAAFVLDGDDGKQHPVVRTLVQDVLVMNAPEAPKATGLAAGSTQAKSVVLRLTDDEAQQVAFAVENGKIWLTVRPGSGSKQHRPALVTVDRLLLGVKPIPVRHFEGAAPWAGVDR